MSIYLFCTSTLLTHISHYDTRCFRLKTKREQEIHEVHDPRRSKHSPLSFWVVFSHSITSLPQNYFSKFLKCTLDVIRSLNRSHQRSNVKFAIANFSNDDTTITSQSFLIVSLSTPLLFLFITFIFALPSQSSPFF